MEKLSAFISYRRHDSYVLGAPEKAPFFEALQAALAQNGFTEVFLDIKALRGAGQAYDSRIAREIQRCDLFIVLVGQDWLRELDDRRTKRRPDDAAAELRLAITSEKEILPILVDGAAMPNVDALPEDLAELHFADALAVKSEMSPHELAAALRPAVEKVLAGRIFGPGWKRGYLIFSVIAWILCAIVPNVTGLLEYRGAWGHMAATWAGFFIWPAIFLPFAMMAYYVPFRVITSALINAKDTLYRLQYAIPYAAGILVTIIAMLLEVYSADQSPWTIMPAFPPTASADACGHPAGYSNPELAGLVAYDHEGTLKAEYKRKEESPFWLENKCWPNVMFFLTEKSLPTAELQAERDRLQPLFMSAMRSADMPRNHVPYSKTFWAYAISFFILILFGATGVSMAIFFVAVRLRRPTDDTELKRPSEEGYLYLTLAFLSLMWWVPFRMLTISTKLLYNCGHIGQCPTDYAKYMNDFVLGAALIIGYACVAGGLLIQFRRVALTVLGLFCVLSLLGIGTLALFHGADFISQVGEWRFDLAVAIPAIFILMMLWFQFNPAFVRSKDFRRMLQAPDD